MFVKRGRDGEIIAVSRDMTPEIAEPLDTGAPELMQFLRGEASDTLGAFRASDLDVVRVLEDLVEVLVNRGVIQFTDLPDVAQRKLLSRKRLRQSGAFSLAEEDDSLI